MEPVGTLLIVDGGALPREPLAVLLAGQGYRLLAARDSVEAIALAAGLAPDLIVVDLDALGEQGVDVCRALRAEPALAEVPCLVAVSAGARPLGRQALEQGVDDLIARPFHSVELGARLKTYTRLNRYRRQLVETIGRHAAEATILNHVGQVITSSLDLQETLSIIADHAHWLMDVAATSVILCDEEKGELWFGAAYGERADFVQGKRLAKGHGIAHWVIHNGEPLVVQDVSQDARFFPGWDQESGFTTQSILCVPLRVKSRTIGAIEAINKTSGAFDDEDLALITSLAASAAIAIENARLYEQAQQAEEKIRHLYGELQERANNLEKMVAERTQQLQAERDRTQAILEAVGEAVIVTDLEGRIQYLNPAAIELTGYTLEEVAGRSPGLWQQSQPAEDRPPPMPGAQAVYRADREVVSRRKDGALYDAATTVAPLFDSQDPKRPVGHVCVQRDITPIKDAERLKDQFVSNVSHEMRTPLSVIALISGNLDRLYDRLTDEKRRKLIRDIREHAQVLNELIGDVLEISRIESRHISMERARLDLAQLLREEARTQAPLAHRKGQELRAIGHDPVLVLGQDEQLRQVVRNLLNNAIKYTPAQGKITCDCREVRHDPVEPVIETARAAPEDAVAWPATAEEAWPGSRALPAGRWAGLRIVDNGIGISPEDLPHVYERFYRVKTEGNVPGTGLGLSIARELIEAHDGQIAVASSPGRGSVFAIYLPLLEE